MTFSSGCNNPHKDRIIRKIQNSGLEVIVKLVKENLTKTESQSYERYLIAEIGIDNLSNICIDAYPPTLYGKDNGFYGKTHTEENKVKCGNANRGRNNKTPEGAKSISNAMKQRWEDPVKRENQIAALKSRKGEKRSKAAIESYKKAAVERDKAMTPEQRAARTKAGNETKKVKYAGLKRQQYIDQEGKRRYRWVPE